MSSRREQLEQLAARIERLATAPDAVKSRWMWLARPFYRLLGWQPRYETETLDALLARLSQLDEDVPSVPAALLEAAVGELDDNVARAERACKLNSEIPTSHVAWLSRLVRVVARIDHSVELGFGKGARRALATIDPVMVAKPLALATSEEQASSTASSDRSSQRDETIENDRPQARLIELQLAAIDHITEAARGEVAFLDRRRRLLEAARRLLLDADAALPLDADAVRIRKRYLAEQIVHVDRIQATGLSPHVSLLHQARSALSRGQREQLHAALVALEDFALASGDLVGADKVSRPLDELTAGVGSGQQHRRHSLHRSAQQMFGEQVASSIDNAYRGARKHHHKRLKKARGYDAETIELALEYLAPGSESATMSALLSVDGCFDVGAPLCPVRVMQHETVARVVPYPTQQLLLRPARKPEDVATAVIHDPRTVLMDLVVGRLLTRKYVQFEQRQHEHTKMVGEARVYLLDGSTSMLTHGKDMARARMRDAILVAELSTLMARFQNPKRYTRVVLYYRYFTKQTQAVTHISDADGALAAIGEVLSTPRRGGTNIELALASSFDTIRDAAAHDPDLARAQIVLITDGKAVVRDDVVRKAREAVGEMPIAVSVIALGEENAALRRLVARQRSLGERAFYHFIDDQTLAELCDGKAGSSRAIHLPHNQHAAPPKALQRKLALLLDEVAQLDRERHNLVRVASSDDDTQLAALEELGLSASALSDGQRAQRDAAARDRRALTERYERWFIATDEHEGAEQTASSPAQSSEIDSVVVVLSTVAEVVGELGGDELARKADAIDVVERLLPDARLSPARFDELLRQAQPQVRAALAAVHAATAVGVR